MRTNALLMIGQQMTPSWQISVMYYWIFGIIKQINNLFSKKEYKI